MDYKKEKELFNSLSSKEQWNYVLTNKTSIRVYLDSDLTSFYYISENDEDDVTLFYLKEDIGIRSGVNILFDLLEIKVE